VLDDPAAHALYDVSQGITAVAATVYLLAQRRAISRGIEVIDERVIRSVARDSQNLIREALDQLRQGKRLAPRVGLKRHIPDLDMLHTGAAAGSNGEPRSGQNGGGREDSADGDSTAQAAAQATDVSEAASKTNEEVGRSPEPRKKSRPRKLKPGKDDLRNLSPRSGTGTEESARLKAKHVRPATEFLEEGV
jgi:hypothetical protein